MEKLTARKLASAVAIAGISALALTGCGESPEVLKDQPATVLEHEYTPPGLLPMLVGKVILLMPTPEHFYLDVEQCGREGDKHADEQGCVDSQVEVNSQTYKQYPDGSQITFK